MRRIFARSKSAVVVGQQRAGIAQRAEILRREKTDRAEIAHRADLLAAIGRAHRLRRILDHAQAVLSARARARRPCPPPGRRDAPA